MKKSSDRSVLAAARARQRGGESRVMAESLESRVYAAIVRGIRDLIAVAPPLVITHEEIDELMAAIGKTLDQLWD